MALSIGSIVSRYSMSKNEGINPADRAYLDECRRNSAVLLEVTDASHLQPHPLASSKLSMNPYHESFRAAQKEFLLQHAIAKRTNQFQWNWKKTALLTVVLAILLAIIIVLACVYARDVSHGHYVQFFSALILILFVSCFLIAIATKLHPVLSKLLLRRSCAHRAAASHPESLSHSDDPEEQPSKLDVIVVATEDDRSSK